MIKVLLPIDAKPAIRLHFYFTNISAANKVHYESSVNCLLPTFCLSDSFLISQSKLLMLRERASSPVTKYLGNSRRYLVFLFLFLFLFFLLCIFLVVGENC